MLRTRFLARVLWSLTGVAALASCGRLGFSEDAIAIVTPPLELVTECGVEPSPGDVEILNDGTIPLVIEGATTTGGFSVLTPLPVVIQPEQSATLSIMPPAAVIGTDVSGALKTGILTLSTNEGVYLTHTFDLIARVVGAQLGFAGASMPVTLTFSAASACPVAQGVTFVNTGDRDMSLALIPPATSFKVTDGFAGSWTLDAGSSSYVSVAVDTAGPCSGSATVAYAVTGSVCSANPAVFDATFTITGLGNCACS